MKRFAGAALLALMAVAPGGSQTDTKKDDIRPAISALETIRKALSDLPPGRETESIRKTVETLRADLGKDLRARIALAELDVEMRTERVAWSARMVAKEYLSRSQADSDVAALANATLALNRLRDNLSILAKPATGGEKQPAKKRLLVITESKGFRHGCVTRKNNELSLVEKIIHELADKHGFFEVVCSQDSRKEITGENLKTFDAVFFYTTGELPLSDAQKSDLLAFIRNGKGFMGAHSATDTFYKWKEYGDLIGAYFERHPPGIQKIKVIVEDTKHPATKHLGESFDYADEIYQFKGPYSRENLRILMRVDDKTGKNQWRKDGDNALAWVRDYGKGRVFYTALGHQDKVWQDPLFQQHLIGGLRYVTGLENADATPSGKK